MRQHHLHRAIQRAPADLEAGHDPAELSLKEWLLNTKCTAHAAHNALHWAMKTQFQDSKALLEDLWIVFAALRNSSNLLHDYLGSWLALHLKFVDRALLPTEAESSTLWSALGLLAYLLPQ
eukprot:2470604-Lingulodinium_polyedra.AAC.1